VSSENKHHSSVFEENTGNPSDSNQNCTDSVTENLNTDLTIITAEKCPHENTEIGNNCNIGESLNELVRQESNYTTDGLSGITGLKGNDQIADVINSVNTEGPSGNVGNPVDGELRVHSGAQVETGNDHTELQDTSDTCSSAAGSIEDTPNVENNCKSYNVNASGKSTTCKSTRVRKQPKKLDNHFLW